MRPTAWGRRAGILLGVGALVFAAVTTAADEIEPAPSPTNAEIPCLERAIVVAYLHHFQDQIMQRWVVPEDTIGDQSVVVRFRLTDAGRFKSWKLVSWTNRRLANSVELAFQHARLSMSIPERAACLIGRPIDIRFENPY